MDIGVLENGACVRVPLSFLKPAPWGNVRRGTRSESKKQELRESIQAKGVLQSITVRPSAEGEYLEVLAGNGRWEISEELGLPDIPALVRHCGDKEGMAIGLAENSAREDLTIKDEILLAQECVSYADADYEEAAKVLGWEERKLRSRLQLNQCSEDVLDALAGGQIKIGHAEVLCQFTDKLQNGTLEKIISESWTVSYLKERANGAARMLRYAKFDTGDCEGCPHNSTVQASLFDNHIGGEKCTNLPCFKEKTEAWVSTFKLELEREEGVVLLAVEKPQSDRNTVSSDVVGEAFESDCLNCVSRVRILQDGINRDCGDVTDNQCINLSCFKEKVEAVTPKKPTTKGSTKRTSTKKKKSKPEIPAGVKQQAESFVRGILGDALLENANYTKAVTLFSVARAAGYTIEGLVKRSAADEIAEMTGWDAARLDQETSNAIRHGTLIAQQGASFEGVRTMLRCRYHVDDRGSRAVSGWAPSKEWLATYQKGGIESFCKTPEIRFDLAWEKAYGEGSFAKLLKKKKEEIITAILGFEFDWSEVAPKEVRELVG